MVSINWTMHRHVGRSWLLIFGHILPHLIFMQPNRICVFSNKLVHIHTIDGRWPLDSLLLPIYKNSHVLFPPALLFCPFSGSELTFTLCHNKCCSFIAITLNHTFRPVRPQHNSVFKQIISTGRWVSSRYAFSILKPAILANSILCPQLTDYTVWILLNNVAGEIEISQIGTCVKLADDQIQKSRELKKWKKQYAVYDYFGVAL